MTGAAIRLTSFRYLTFVAALATGLVLSVVPVGAQTRAMAYKQALAETVARDPALAAFYRERNYLPVWTGASDADTARLRALLWAVARAGDHALPASRYDPEAILAALRSVSNERARGRAEADLSRVYLRFARDLQSGVLVPRAVDRAISRDVLRRGTPELMQAILSGNPTDVMRSFAPATQEYTRLMGEKQRLERLRARGGWGDGVSANKLEPGDSGALVVELRNRLISMGYLSRTASTTYDAALQNAVLLFQDDHGLNADGIAGPSTIAEINVGVDARLRSIAVAMERERWMNFDRGARHVRVNLADFTAKIIDNGIETFSTRAIVGKNTSRRRTPEFSDQMEFMVINPTWFVPRSITTREYLPQLQRNPNAQSQLRLFDSSGRQVNRGNVDFTQFTEGNFPYSLQQPPSSRNALGRVKFMFPNPFNIYLHDTPAQNLFANEKRDFSHGCVRLDDPFEFAYALLARQTDDPVSFFAKRLNTGRETQVNLEQPVPVHLIYRTTFTKARGRVNFRRDIYERDARIWEALEDAGVVLGAVQG